MALHRARRRGRGDHGRLLADDPVYADKARRVSELYRDLLEVVEAEVDQLEFEHRNGAKVAVHTPCSMQHGLGISGRVEAMLERAGYRICRVEDAHLCCGSAGTYSMLQPKMAAQLRRNKIRALTVDKPDIIATANVGCQLHIAHGNRVPVRHWIELI